MDGVATEGLRSRITVSRPGLVTLTFALPLGIALAEARGWRVILVASLAVCAASILLYALIGARRHRSAAAAAVAIAVAGLGIEAAILPGAALPALGALPAVVIISALLLGRRTLLWTGPLAMVAVALPTLLGLFGLGSLLPGPVSGPIGSGGLILLLGVTTASGAVLGRRVARVDSSALQEAVYAIATVAAQEELHPRDFYKRIHAIIGTLMPAENAYFVLYDEAAQTVSMPYFVDQKDYVPDPSWRPVGDGLVEYLLRADKPLLADTAKLAEMKARGELIVRGTVPCSVVGIPLRIGERVIGALVVQSYSEAERYTAEHLEILEYVSRQVAMAVNRRVAEGALRDSEEKYRSMFSRSAVSLWEVDISALRNELSMLHIHRNVTDPAAYIAEHPEFVHRAAGLARFVDVNDATLELYEAGRREDLLGPATRLLGEDGFEGFARALCAIAEGRAYFECEQRARTLKGKLLHTVLRYAIPAKDDRRHHMLLSVIDVTERRRAEEERARLEEQLRQSQRMESIGRLAGGVAHDFNNMLAPIIGYADLLLGALGQDDQQRDGLREILGAAERARDLTRQLLAFSRRQILSVRPIDLRSVVVGFEKLLRRTIREDIRIELQVPPAPVVARADAGQIEQVLMNLAVNAQDAMPEGGVLTLSLEEATITDEAAPTGVAPGRYALLAVRDTGVGIAPEVRPHLFEPFYTTKGLGKGTGLGLSTVYGIVQQHGGALDVASEPRKGATFRIYLPVVEEEAGTRPEEPGQQGEAPRGSETIMVVEDRDDVRGLATAMLKRQGYQVLAAGSAEEAMRLSEADPVRIDLLLTDVVMPGANGRELYGWLSSSRPGLRVLYMSGYTGETIASKGILEEGVELLFKPFTLDRLARRVRAILDAKH